MNVTDTMPPKKKKRDANTPNIKSAGDYLYDKQKYISAHTFKAGQKCIKSSELKFVTGKPNTSNAKTVSTFDFVIENNNKYLTFLPNHLLVYAKVIVNAKPKGETNAKDEQFYLNYDLHRLSMINGISGTETFLKISQISVLPFTYPLSHAMFEKKLVF